MSRVVTASEVDRLHCQVAELQQQVKELLNFAELAGAQILLPASTQTPRDELFEDLEVDASQDTGADPVVDEIVAQGKHLER